MMNWLYTWYKPRVDPDAETLAREISDIFLQGVRGRAAATGNRARVVQRQASKTARRTPAKRLRYCAGGAMTGLQNGGALR